MLQKDQNIKMVLVMKTAISSITRMHSSRMRTARSLTVSPNMLWSGGEVPGPGGCLVWGVPAWSQGGACLVPEGACLVGGGGIPACTEADPPMDRIRDTRF